jgi:hypothetical protein
VSSYHRIEALSFDSSRLEITIAELLKGEADGLIGLPLMIPNDSKRYRISFEDVERIEIAPEPMPQLSSGARVEAPFLYLESESKFKTEHAWAPLNSISGAALTKSQT